MKEPTKDPRPYIFTSSPTGFMGVMLAESDQEVRDKFFERQPNEEDLKVQPMTWPEHTNAMQSLREEKDHIGEHGYWEEGL